jgi:hypothetical protein
MWLQTGIDPILVVDTETRQSYFLFAAGAGMGLLFSITHEHALFAEDWKGERFE